MNFTEKEVSEKMNISVQTLRNWRCLRKGPAFLKIGGAVRYRERDIEEYIDRIRIDPKKIRGCRRVSTGFTLKALGSFLYKKREESKLTSQQLSKKIKEPGFLIRDLELGTFGIPYPKTIKKLADFYGVSSAFLLYLAGFDLKEEITARIKWEAI